MEKPKPKPNIIIIFADDLGYGDIGCYGATKIPTPNIDRVATEGMKFLDAHSCSAVCTPSRYALLTGRYCWRTGLKKWIIGPWGKPLIEKSRSTIGTLCQKHGYRTAAIGKWHLGMVWETIEGYTQPEIFSHPRVLDKTMQIDFSKPIRHTPNDIGFDYFYGLSGSLNYPPYCFIENHHTVGIPSIPKNPLFPSEMEGLMVPGWDQTKVDVTHTEKAIEFMQGHISEHPDQPFLLYLPTAAPHRPCNVQPDFIKGISGAGDRGDMVALFDWVVGQVDAFLRDNNLLENTLLIVTSDNGGRLTCANGKDYGHKTNGILRGQKADIWEGGHKEPLIIRWPNSIEESSTNTELMGLNDIYATIANILDEKTLLMNEAEDSVNMLPSLINGAQNPALRASLVHHSGAGLFSLRSGKWKIVLGLGSGGFTRPKQIKPRFWRPKGQLYDMGTDPLESTNLWKENPEVVKHLTKLLDEIITSEK